MEVTEVKITINGYPLTLAQSMTFRVALESFASDLSSNGLGNDVDGMELAKLYLMRTNEIRQLMYKGK